MTLVETSTPLEIKSSPFGVNLDQISINGIAGTLWRMGVCTGKYPLLSGMTWSSNGHLNNLKTLLDVVIDYNGYNSANVYGTSEGVLIYASWDTPCYVGFSIAADSKERLEFWEKELKKLFPPVVETDDKVFVNFYAYDPKNGVQSYGRSISITPWLESSDNYSMSSLPSLKSLIELEKPQLGGKLILLHGDPGTGKTSFIRTLCHAWKSWINVAYVIDPDRFFQESAYMMSILTGNNSPKDKWRIVIIEDSDEFLMANSKSKTGQGLSRLLNLTDGILGQGLKILLIITTNESVSKMHPAIVRRGRCLADVAFPKLTVDEANRWLRLHKVEGVTLTKEMYLTDLYGFLSPEQIKTEKNDPGYGNYI